MKIKENFKSPSMLALRPSINAGAVLICLVFATTVTSALAVDGTGTDLAQQPEAIRPFQIHVSENAVIDLRRRIASTSWPDKETVTDGSQGVQIATIQALARYWATDYDWRKCEAKLNALPQFMTEVDGLDIHFIHVRSRHPNALPVIITHGWPGSVIEQLKIIDPLTNPTGRGASFGNGLRLDLEPFSP